MQLLNIYFLNQFQYIAELEKYNKSTLRQMFEVQKLIYLTNS